MITEHSIHIHNGEHLYYKQAGSANNILILVHGNMSSSVFFDDLLKDLSTSYTVYAIDLRGFGQSSSLRRVGSVKSLSNDLVAFIQDMKFDHVSLLGWSLGGGVVLEAAAELRNKVKHIFLLSSLGLKGFNSSLSLLMKESVLMQGIKNKFLTLSMMPWNAFISFKTKRTLVDTYVMRKYLDDYLYHLNQPSESDYEKYLDAIADQKNFLEVYQAIINFNITHCSNGIKKGNGRANLITADIHIMHGRYDRVVHLSEARETYEYFKDQATLDVFEHSGHAIMTDEKEKLIHTISHYMNQ